METILEFIEVCVAEVKIFSLPDWIFSIPGNKGLGRFSEIVVPACTVSNA
ncbi:MAG: hypothetical protein ACJAQT_003249 [Akkermansiaceae bacterium]|jgi:hypothetical protein